MPKIIYEEDNLPPKQRERRLNQFIVIFLVLSFIMGIVGGAGAIVLISENAKLRRVLGVTDTSPLNLTRTVNERLVVEESNGFIQTVDKVSPAVVAITTKREGVDIFGQIIEREGAGTGFIITSDGLIVTNKHVVSDERATYTVLTAEGKTYDATVQARDPFNDFAVLKIEATGLPVVELGDSDRLAVGQWVVAIGNAFGEFENSVSVGVVSAKNRKLEGQGAELTGLIQTDAAINPGNSGGPLVNLKGQVVGINTAIASPTGSSVGIGFALPVNAIKKSIDSVRKTGKITRPMLGVRYINVDPTIQRQLDLSVERGAMIFSGDVRTPGVQPGGPAAQAGLRERDIILELNGERIDENRPLSNLLTQYAPGDEVTLKVLRDGKEFETKLKLGEMK